ncbi:MAG: hypothetical protein IPG69_18250 [Flavobacteriales bacterium]|nr:hypothetical protein [Flavobacteriales bacterium]MBK9077369.1 hypothetical protein [Flavobacteriales bacterium]
MNHVLRPLAGHRGLVHLIRIDRPVTLLLLTMTLSFRVGAQDTIPQHHEVFIAPTAVGNSSKPVMEELEHWIPDADIRFERTTGRLNITTATPFSLTELKTHIEQFGFVVIALGYESHQNTTERADEVDTDGTDNEPLDDAARAKAIWIEAYPEVYQNLLRNSSPGQDGE